MTRTVRSRLKASVAVAAVCAQLAVRVEPASAFCGFYVAKADAKMFNKSSKVVLARNGQQTAITMASDYEGEPSEFALVVPVPTFIEKNQISVVEPKTVDHLDAYTAPRLVEYYDADPCEQRYLSAMPASVPRRVLSFDGAAEKAAYAGVKVEATYDVAEYDISILSAEESDGLIRWLNDNGYKIPTGAEPVIKSYIKQKNALLCRQDEPQAPARARPHLFAAAAGALRHCEIHAAAAARHRQRQRSAGPDRLRAHPQRPGQIGRAHV